jgi:hypothetical protein
MIGKTYSEIDNEDRIKRFLEIFKKDGYKDYEMKGKKMLLY